ncbi:MAG: hypothetical protein AB7P40_00260 [Chloroflexota bacterium]
MIDFLRRTGIKSDPNALTAATARRLSGNLGAVITGAGCLTGNLAQAAADVQQRLADGALTEVQAAMLINKLHSIHQDIERACTAISGVRAEMAPPVPVQGEARGGHHA